ncbi:hypothetical protein BDP27DRAFT_1441256 [Rhodocollybia butyracea]|uniref:DUF6533 domain-containing protein n=1 Tax=Rhodocollybia butyracea TaxID=206335 RepID=A0A9P5QAA9_9AGAR|nr:hypothetical protein BDP27DRAFT_1441256 [Rhodocollybia butyracea]
MNSPVARAHVDSAARQQQLEDYFHLFAISRCIQLSDELQYSGSPYSSISILGPPNHPSSVPLNRIFEDTHLTKVHTADEVQYLWKRPVSASTALFFVNRYFACFGNAVVTISLFSSGLNDSSCAPFHLFRELLLVLTQVFVCGKVPVILVDIEDTIDSPADLVLLTIRIYALYHCSKRILIYMLVTGFTLAGLAIFSIFFGQSSQSKQTGTGCHTQLPLITSIRTLKLLFFSPFQLSSAIEVAAAWEALFLYDSMLFIMTLRKAQKTRHELHLERRGISLITIILRDGSMYFGVMAFANLINISTFYYPDVRAPEPHTNLHGTRTNPAQQQFLRGAMSTFASATSVTMMSRLMLNLHQIASSGLYTSHITTCQIGAYSTFVAPAHTENSDSTTMNNNETLYNESQDFNSP